MATTSRAKRAAKRTSASPTNRPAAALSRHTDEPAATSLYHGEETPAVLTKGHGTAALGPSDSSDSGSNIPGGPGLNRDDGLLQPPGTTSDPDVDTIGATAGPDIGDADLDSDSDRNGTGERAAAGRDSTVPTDVILRDESDHVVNAESLGDTTDADAPTSAELAAANAERGDIADHPIGIDLPSSRSYHPARAGQDMHPVPVNDGRLDPDGEASEPGETSYARADGKRATNRDDVPVFDRAGREDLPRDRRGRRG
jgi:hypothetical protein